jgi:hypothetical protein
MTPINILFIKIPHYILNNLNHESNQVSPPITII